MPIDNTRWLKPVRLRPNQAFALPSFASFLFKHLFSALARNLVFPRRFAAWSGPKMVEQELTEGTEVLRSLCYLLFQEFGRGYVALLTSASMCSSVQITSG
jgi:hypothetical protein